MMMMKKLRYKHLGLYKRVSTMNSSLYTDHIITVSLLVDQRKMIFYNKTLHSSNSPESRLQIAFV